MPTKPTVISYTPTNSKDVVQMQENICALLGNSANPEFVIVNLTTSDFPRRILDMPAQLRRFLMANSRIKIAWDEFCPDLKDEYDIKQVYGLDKIPNGLEFLPENDKLDMTMVSVFYDSGINELRKVATRKAVSHWLEQYHLPKEMMFIELGFNGVFTFSKEDFPEQIDYIRIDGNDSHKYLFQKEHLWNIAAKRAKYEKLMFVDSDIAPMGDVDWFKQVYEQLDKYAIVHGFESITYLDENDQKIFNGMSITLSGKDNKCKKVSGGVYCISKKELNSIGYFNSIPFGGGDDLLWHELGQHSELPIILVSARGDIRKKLESACCSTGKNIFSCVPANVFHFYHGDLKTRSYTERQYLLLTQFPWKDRIISEDQSGLLFWIDVKHYFYHVAEKISLVNNDPLIAGKIISENIDYKAFRKQVSQFKVKGNRGEVIRLLRNAVIKATKVDNYASNNHNVDYFSFFRIVIPNYNNKLYLEQCLQSIITQTFQDFRIIVVDDMSDDGSFDIAQKYCSSYPGKIVCINPGQKLYAGGCRNIGIDYSGISSCYTLAIDGDDFLFSTSSLQELYDCIQNNNFPDAVFFNGYIWKHNKTYRIPERKPIDLTTPSGCDPTCHTLCCVKSDMFAHYPWNLTVGQDLIHQYGVLKNIKTYVNIDNKIYVYRFNWDSISHVKPYSRRWLLRERHRNNLIHLLENMQKHEENSNIANNIQTRIGIVHKRIEKENYIYRPVVVALASFPGRFEGMMKVVRQLRTQCDKMYVWLNDYNEIPCELKEYDNVFPVLANDLSHLKENGRLFWVNQFPNSYYLTVDDDINYPPNYVQEMIYNIEKYYCKCIVAYHGSIFSDREHIIPFQKETLQDMQVHRVGGGVCGMVPEEIGFVMPDLHEIDDWDGDASISVWATLNGVKKICLKKDEGWLSHIIVNGKQLSVDNKALCLNRTTLRKRKAIYQKLSDGWEQLEDPIKYSREYKT